jgi:hypothetical protein
MLASQRTTRLQRGHAQMQTFDPAEILPAGAITPITCVMGPLRKLGQSLNPGGLVPDLQLAFRVPRASFVTAPILGGQLQWRIPGEGSYRGTVKIENIIDRPSIPYLVIGCVNVNQ